MAILVDRVKTRAQVAELAADLIAEQGMGALSTRSVAEAAGTSRAIVATYFENMRDLLIATYQQTALRAATRWDVELAAGGSLQDCLEALLPLDSESRRFWRVYLAFHGAAAADQELAAMQRAHVHHARTRIEHVIAESQGLSKPTRAMSLQARIIFAFVMGIGTSETFEETPSSPREQRQLLRDLLSAYGLSNARSSH